jgi:hypothetical protein
MADRMLAVKKEVRPLLPLFTYWKTASTSFSAARRFLKERASVTMEGASFFCCSHFGSSG